MKFSTVAALALAGSAVAIPAVPVTKRDNGGSQFSHDVIDPMPNTTLSPYPTYKALTNFDYASLLLGLYQEFIEYNLFHYGLVRFTPEEFEEAGITAADQSLLLFMANQESGHATLLSNLLGLDINDGQPGFCTYNYTGAFDSVRSYVDFNQRLTRWGESGVWGFLSKMNSQDSAQLLSQSIATEARQQMVFRQFTGAQPFPVFFESGIPQNWQWTLLAPYISSCPSNTPRITWSNFPALRITNVAPLAQDGSQAAISTNRTANTSPGQSIHFEFDKPGQKVGPNNSYTTRIMSSGVPKYAMFLSQLNATYVPLENVTGSSADAYLPDYLPIYQNDLANTTGILNGTSFAILTDDNPYVSPYNVTYVNANLVAGPAIIQFG